MTTLLHHRPLVVAMFMSPWMVVSTLLRFLIMFGMLHNVSEFFYSSSLSSSWIQSTMVRPNHLLEHVLEATAIQQQFVSTTTTNTMIPSKLLFSNAYRIQDHIQLPPLLLAFWQTLLQQQFPSTSSSSSLSTELSIVVSLILIWMVDVGIAVLLYLIGQQFVHMEQSDPWEDVLLRQMHKSIQPPQGYIVWDSNPLVSSANGSKHENENIDKRTSNDSNSNHVTTTDPSNVATCGEESSSSENMAQLSRNELNLLLAFLYYASPISMLGSGLYGSFQNFWILILLFAIYRSCQSHGSISLTAFCLAIVTYAELHYVVFVIPCAIWIHQRRNNNNKEYHSSKWRYTSIFLGFFVTWTVGLHVLSCLLVGRRTYLSILASSYGFRWNQQHVNLGLLWYFQMQVFRRFRRYFLILITGLPYILVLPLSLRLHSFPMVLVTLFWWLFTIFRPVPTLHDLNVGFCLMLLCPQTVARMGKASLISLCALAVPVSLYVLDCSLWLETGSGNANFIFFQCLVYQVFVVILFLDFTSSSLRRDKALRLTQRLGIT